jgi:hypothetical protein
VLGTDNNGDGVVGKDRARSTSPGRKAVGGTNRDRRVLMNMEDHLYQLEDWRTLTRLQRPVHDGL